MYYEPTGKALLSFSKDYRIKHLSVCKLLLNSLSKIISVYITEGWLRAYQCQIKTTHKIQIPLHQVLCYVANLPKTEWRFWLISHFHSCIAAMFLHRKWYKRGLYQVRSHSLPSKNLECLVGLLPLDDCAIQNCRFKNIFNFYLWVSTCFINDLKYFYSVF